MTRSRIALPLVFLLLLGVASAQSRYAIRDAKIVTVSGNPIERGTVLIENGLVSAVGARVSIPRGTGIINGRNLSVYPGLFNSNTTIGLTEIGSVPVTSDNREMGEFMPHLLAFSAFHIESAHIPVARVDGITHILSRPSGGILPGQGALMHMDGWSHEELEISRRGALMLSLPALLGGGGRRGRGGGGSYTQAKERFDEKITEIKELFARARYYGKSKQDGLTTKMDRQLEALVPALNGEQVVLLEANSHVDIQEAVKFAQAEKLNFVILGRKGRLEDHRFSARQQCPSDPRPDPGSPGERGLSRQPGLSRTRCVACSGDSFRFCYWWQFQCAHSPLRSGKCSSSRAALRCGSALDYVDSSRVLRRLPTS